MKGCLVARRRGRQLGRRGLRRGLVVRGPVLGLGGVVLGLGGHMVGAHGLRLGGAHGVVHHGGASGRRRGVVVAVAGALREHDTNQRNDGKAGQLGLLGRGLYAHD